MSQRFMGQTALVTGSTQGIGRGIARRLASEGAAVVINDAGSHDGAAVAAELRDRGAEATYVEADACDPAAIEGLVERAAAEHGQIDVLVNNVGTWRHQSLRETAVDDWEYVFDGSVRSHWLTTKHAVEHMPGGGSVVNISSVHALAADPGRFPYNVAKAAVNALTRALAVELGVMDVRVNGIMPGAIDTSLEDPGDQDLVESGSKRPVGRRGVPADIAAAVAYLASDEAGFVSGAVIPVDGGVTAVHNVDGQREWNREHER